MLVIAAVALAIKDMSGGNRPHELTLSPVVALLLLANAGLLFRLLRLSRRAWAVRRGPWLALLQLGLWGYAGLSLLLLVTAASTAVEVLLAR